MSTNQPGNDSDQREPPRKNGGCKLIAVLCAVLILIGLGFLIQPFYSMLTEAGPRSRSINNLKMLSLGMLDYHDASKPNALPAAAICDQNGKPLLSWRVAILPYIGQAPLYSQFRLDEPWDSPNNLPLLHKMPEVYQDPGKPHATNTHYRVFQGPGAAFEGTKKFNLRDDFPDGPSVTILITEADEAVPWTKPDELEYDADGPLPKLGGLRRGTVFVAMADGTVRIVQVEGNERNIRAAITRNGGETLPKDW